MLVVRVKSSFQLLISLHSLCRRTVNEWLQSEEGWKAFKGRLMIGYKRVMICFLRFSVTDEDESIYGCSTTLVWMKYKVGAANGDHGY